VTGDTLTLPAVASSVPEARRFVRDALHALAAAGACDDAETLVSELATNAVLHARTEYTITVARTDGTVRVRVHDMSAVLPRQRTYGADSTTGRGIRLIASIAQDWGVEAEGEGKAVWFELPVEGRHAAIPSWDDEIDVEALLDSFDDDTAGTDGDAPSALALAA
jgi:anti-sigma regulatory factor (Ser/Thr protein kinase)